MSDIWSGIGVNLPGGHDEWVYRLGGEIRGPLPKQTIINKLLSGEIKLDTPVGREGGELHPIERVAAFSDHLEEARKRAEQRAARKRRRILTVIGLPALLAAAGGGYLVYRGVQQARAEVQATQRAGAQILARSRSRMAKQPKLDLVALPVAHLSSEQPEKQKEGRRARGRRQRRRRRMRAARRRKNKSASDSIASTCQRDNQDIIKTLSRHLRKINVCVQDERKRSGDKLPDALELDFIVKPSGRVVEFAIDHRHYRRGPMKNCMTKVFRTVRYPRSGGTACPVSIPIKVSK